MVKLSARHFNLRYTLCHSSKTHRKHERFLRDIASLNPDVLVHAGDWASNRQHQFYRSMLMFRNAVSCPIFAVRGNHDFWQLRDKRSIRLSYEETLVNHLKCFKEIGIHHADFGPLEIGGYSFYGFDGWYRTPNPPTNDEMHLPYTHEGLPIMELLTRKAYRDLSALIERLKGDRRKRVCVTHFPPFSSSLIYRDLVANENHLPIIEENFGVLMCGHSHLASDWHYKGLRIINSGSDYDAPQLSCIDLD